MNAVVKNPNTEDFKVRDLSLADWGRKEIDIAEHEMPGLMSIREKYAQTKPLKGVRVTGSLHMTIETAVLIETLVDARRVGALGLVQHLLDAGPRRRRDRQDRHAGLRVEGRDARGILGLHARCRHASRATKVPQLVVDDGGDVTLLIHKGYELEDGDTWVDTAVVEPRRAGHQEPAQARREGTPGLLDDGRRRTGKASPKRRRPACIASTRCSRAGKLLVPAINVNDSVTKSKFDNLYGCRESLADGLKRATDVMIAGKVAVVCGYGDVGKGSAHSLRGFGARVIVTEIDPINALQAAMEGFEVTTIEDTLGRGDIYVTTTGNKDVITLEHMQR